MSTPNILLVYTDQHRYDCIGAHGHPLLRTPHLDRLASEGVSFAHAFCPAPVCVPSRNSLLFGQWPTEHLAIANPDTEAPRSAREGLPTFSERLRECGYHLAHVGKSQVHPTRTPLDYSFHEHVSDREYGPWRAAQGLPPRPHKNGFFGEVDPGIAPDESRLGWGASQTIRILEERAGSGEPFFVRWNTSEPHLPNIVPEPYYSMYPPEAIAPWPSYPDPLVGKPYIQAQQRRSWGLQDWTWEDWAPFVSRYLGEVSLLDAQVGRVLAALDRLGLAENTVVVYTPDHGDMCGGHGMIDKHYVMYDDVTRVPLLIRWPGRALAGHRSEAFVCNALDLAVTFCEVAGAPVPDTFRGASLLPLLAGDETSGRQDIMSAYHGNQFGLYSTRMMRNRQFKYVWNATAEDELYDLAADPGELHNLATGPGHAEVLAQLRRRLLQWMEDTRDPLVNLWVRAQLSEGRKV